MYALGSFKHSSVLVGIEGRVDAGVFEGKTRPCDNLGLEIDPSLLRIYKVVDQ